MGRITLCFETLGRLHQSLAMRQGLVSSGRDARVVLLLLKGLNPGLNEGVGCLDLLSHLVHKLKGLVLFLAELTDLAVHFFAESTDQVMQSLDLGLQFVSLIHVSIYGAFRRLSLPKIPSGLDSERLGARWHDL